MPTTAACFVKQPDAPFPATCQPAPACLPADVEEGGETALPLAKPIDAVAQAQTGLSACGAKGSMAIKPQKGDALLFWDLKLDGQTGDRAALHASCPTLAVSDGHACAYLCHCCTCKIISRP